MVGRDDEGIGVVGEAARREDEEDDEDESGGEWGAAREVGLVGVSVREST